MYVVLKPKCSMSSIGDAFKSHSSFKFPASCRTTQINIQNDSANIASNCCQSLNIFNDSDVPNCVPVKNGTSDEIDDSNSNGLKNGIDREDPSSTHDSFYECNIVVKGFKDQLIKGKSIWTQHEKQ